MIVCFSHDSFIGYGRFKRTKFDVVILGLPSFLIISCVVAFLIYLILKAFSETEVSGIFCVRITINRAGIISAAKILTSHLIHAPSGELVSNAGFRTLLALTHEVRFPKSTGTTEITLPFEIKK